MSAFQPFQPLDPRVRFPPIPDSSALESNGSALAWLADVTGLNPGPACWGHAGMRLLVDRVRFGREGKGRFACESDGRTPVG